MSDFSKALQKKGTASLGHRKTNSDEALGVNFRDSNNVVLAEVKLDALETNPYQPRTSMDEEKLEELKNSILERGLLQPIVVCPLESNPKRFQIIAGHRRTEAMRRLEKEFIPSIIVKDKSHNLGIDALIENIQRDDLSPIDIAFAVKRIMDESKLKQVDISKMIGKTKGYVSSLLKICNLPEYILEHQKANAVLPLRTLFQISSIHDTDIQSKVFKNACEQELNSEDVKALVESYNAPNESKKSDNFTKESFVYKINKKNVSFKLDLTDGAACQKAIKELEELLIKLKNSKV
jgi:ParB family chromosome partitioning protein